MDDEEPEHPDHLLHGAVRVVEERAVLPQGELVGEAPARFDLGLADAGHAVHLDGHLEAVPVHGGGLGEAVLEQDADAIALHDLDRRARALPL